MVTFVVKNSILHLYIGMCKDLELGKLSGSCDMEVHCTSCNQILQNLDFVMKVKCLLHSLNFSHRRLERPA